ncbi:MAG TPA: DUF6134 family protein [Flavitalea sp.]|nr:DUF6134 family protein [Flavitalea sp.]
MLTLIILLWLRKVRNTGETNAAFLRQQLVKISKSVLPLLILLPLSVFSQTKNYHYQVFRNKDQIGSVSITETHDKERRTIELQSSIKAKMVITVSVCTREKTMLEDQRIVFAESRKKINGNDEVARKLTSQGNGYEFVGNRKQVQLDSTPIYNNTVSLFVNEPTRSMAVFADTFNRMLELKRISEHTYLLELPDGNRNTYLYKDGICHEVKLDHKFFSARIVLDKINMQ